MGWKLGRVIGAAIVAAGIAGCATAPQKTEFSNTRTYEADFDTIWEEIVEFFATRNIPVKNIAKDSGVIFAEAMSIDPSYADCGSLPMYTPVVTASQFNVFVRRKEAAQTVSVNAVFKQDLVGPYNARQVVTCESKGVLERSLLDSIGR